MSSWCWKWSWSKVRSPGTFVMIGNGVNAHGRIDPGMMDLDPRDSMLKHELPPCRENLSSLGENPENRPESVHISRRLLGRRAKPFAVADRVEAFQNSARFCGKQTSSSLGRETSPPGARSLESMGHKFELRLRSPIPVLTTHCAFAHSGHNLDGVEDLVNREV
jgi:hypothetical protein